MHTDAPAYSLGSLIVEVGHGDDPALAASERVGSCSVGGLGGVSVPPGIRTQVPSDLHFGRVRRLFARRQRDGLEQEVPEPCAVAVGDDPDAIDRVLADRTAAFDGGERGGMGCHGRRVGS